MSLKKWLLIIASLVVVSALTTELISQVGDTPIRTDRLTIGSGLPTDKSIVGDVGDGVNNPTVTFSSGSFTLNLPLNADLTKSDLINGTPLKLFEDVGNGTNFTALRAPNALAGDNTYKLPDGDGANTQTLATDGAGNLFWQAVLFDPMTTRGDILGRNSSNITDRLAVGTGANKYLTSDGTDAAWGPILDGTVSGGPGGHIVDNSITSDDLGTESVDTNELKAGAVFNTDVNAAAGIVYSKLLFSNNIDSADLAASSVNTSELAAGAVTEVKIDASFYQTETKSLDNDFTGGSVRFTRIGSTVTISSISTPAGVSDTRHDASSGFVPLAYRPSVTITNVSGLESTRIQRLSVGTSGSLSMFYRDYNGSNQADVPVAFSITFNQ